jgi:outer membrane protein OmpA-like peptidoglycan-associated protein
MEVHPPEGLMQRWLIVAAAGLAGCSSPVEFQGKSTLVVTGHAAPVAAPAPRVEVRDQKIEIHQKIQFDDNRATIRSASRDLMDEIGSVITKNPQIKRIRIEGHASAEGNRRHNKTLSAARARSVMKYLRDHGVPAGELEAVGVGSDRPIADNDTAEGREKNRRVEFVIVDQDVTHQKVEVDAATGKEKVIEDSHERAKDPDGAAGDTSGKRTARSTTAMHSKSAERP